jgi:hypothetical protein
MSTSTAKPVEPGIGQNTASYLHFPVVGAEWCCNQVQQFAIEEKGFTFLRMHMFSYNDNNIALIVGCLTILN